MSYAIIENRLKSGGVVILDGGTGTELERRGAVMDDNAWCGPATLDNLDILTGIHRDYIAAGAEIITVNTYASSRLMLEPAGFADRFDEINKAAVAAAHRARAESGQSGVLVAGSLSHMCPQIPGTTETDHHRMPPATAIAAAIEELAMLLKNEGCDLLLLEMMYDPDRMSFAFEAAKKTGLPVWAGFSARRGDDGRVLAMKDSDTPFERLLDILSDYDVQAAGVMHSEANVTTDALDLVRAVFDGPLAAYPDSGYFAMPNWVFEGVIPPAQLYRYAKEWVEHGAQILGGCCGLSIDHIAALAPLKR